MTENSRLTLVPVGGTETVRKVVHPSGRTMGLVVRMAGNGMWAYVCPRVDCREGLDSESPTAETAATLLHAHYLGHALDRIMSDVSEGRVTIPAKAVG